MRKLLPIFCFLLAALVAPAQTYRSAGEIWTVYSENEEYYLKSIPWDNEEPSLRGTTAVYRNAGGPPIYTIARGFDAANDNRLTLSNDGQVVFYVIDRGADDKKDGLKSINVYKKGELIAGYTEAEITGCDYKKERCKLLYDSPEKDGRNQGSFKPETALFSSGDTVYLIDCKKRLHTFDLVNGKYLGPSDLELSLETLQKITRRTKAGSESLDVPYFIDFPKLTSGKETDRAFAELLGMKIYDIYDTKRTFKNYAFEFSGYLNKDGSLEIEKLETFGGSIPKEKIIEFFKSSRFVSTEVPAKAGKWFIDNQVFFFRNANDAIARRERLAEIKLEKEELAKRLVAETIGGKYIPKDLGDCLVELDKILSEIDRKEISEMKSRDEMSLYHFGLGMWLRNNWGLWGGSRLQKYFDDRGIGHPDNMSGIILDHYYDWVHGKKDAWKEWEKRVKKAN